MYGSHDEEGGEAFCTLDYEVFSAPVTDLTNWRSEGISYRKIQDPTYSEKYRNMYAPDVVKGNDGRFYLYYALAGGCFTGPIHVAVSEKPEGPFSWYGCVKNQDGSDFTRKITFDPGVMNDHGIIRLYFGWSLAVDPGIMRQIEAQGNNELEKMLIQAQVQMFGKTQEEIENEPDGIMGAFMVELEDDMLTVKTEPVMIVPGQFKAANTGFEGHAFYEASSVRKIGNLYYFIYSSQVSHELCYATSKYPDRDFVYRGVIISNGDIGYEGRSMHERLAMTGNNHGSIECINGQWYVFYHRHTHRTAFSRQGCAEKITILPDGSIKQVQMTSCGLNGKPLLAKGKYPAAIACNLTNGNMPHIDQGIQIERVPFITNEGEEHFIADIDDGTLIGYKYFSFTEPVRLVLGIRGDAEGFIQVMADETMTGEIPFSGSSDWIYTETVITVNGTKALYLKYYGTGKIQLKDIIFEAI